MKSRFLIHLFFSLALFISFQTMAQKPTAEIKGFLIDKATGEPILYTPVFLQGTKYMVLTNENGYYSITRIEPGDYILSAQLLGYDSIAIPISLKAGQILNQKIVAEERITQLQTVEIKSINKEYKQTNTTVSVTQITPKEIKSLPSIGGEPDLAQYLQTVPGVVSTGDQGGQIYIRGGAPVQTLTLIDGMWIYNPFHSIGLFSVFDSEMMKSTDIYTAGFGPEYGGRTSAVIDIKTIDGNKNKTSGNVGVNPFAAKAMLNGPIFKTQKGDGMSFVLSGRTSYLNKTSKIIYPYANEDRELPFSFTDIYAKTTLFSDKGSKVSLFGFNFRDKAVLDKSSEISWNSYGAGTNFMLLPGGSSSLINGYFAYSNYAIQITEPATPPRTSNVGGFNGGLDFTYFIRKNEIKYGIGIAGNQTDFTGYVLRSANVLEKQTIGPQYNTELFGFFKYKIVTNRLVIDPGFRLHYYTSLGKISPEPRLGLKYNITEDLRFKSAVGLYSQNLLSTRSDRDVVNLFNGYVSSVNDANRGNQIIRAPLEKSQHAVAGIEYDVTNNIEVSAEGYVKYFNTVVNVNRERIFPDEPLFIAENGRATGIDFWVRYEKKNVMLQGSYSLAWVNRNFIDKNGQEFVYFPHFDRRHNLNFLASYKFGTDNNYELDARFNFGSGFPFTQTKGFFEDLTFNNGIDTDLSSQNGLLGIYYGGTENLNKGRLPYYHRLDISFKRIFKLQQGMKLELNASIINAYNRANLFYFDRVSFCRVNQLPLLPAAGLNFIF